MFAISNFINPPHKIETIESFRSYIELLNEDESMVLTYLPRNEDYQKLITAKSAYDTLSTTQVFNL